MSDRLHEIIAIIGVLHEELIDSGKIYDANTVIEYLEDYEKDVKEHYLNLLLQYYFQSNDLENFKIILLKGAKFDMRFDDVAMAFCNIDSNKENVIEFMEDSVVYIKDEVGDTLKKMYDYYMANKEIQYCLEQSVEIIKRNRFICAYCYKNFSKEECEFFTNDDLLQSLKRDLPHLLK